MFFWRIFIITTRIWILLQWIGKIVTVLHLLTWPLSKSGSSSRHLSLSSKKVYWIIREVYLRLIWDWYRRRYSNSKGTWVIRGWSLFRISDVWTELVTQGHFHCLKSLQKQYWTTRCPIDNSLCEAEKAEHGSGAISTSHYSEFQAFGDQALNDIYMHPCEMNFVR